VNKLLLKVVFSLFFLLACEGNFPTLPDVPNVPNVPNVPGLPNPPPLPRVDQPFDVDKYKGILAFGIGNPLQTEDDVRAFINAAMAKGWNTFQPCAETEFWDSPPQFPPGSRDPERLKWLLDIFASIPGAQVTLVGNCTLKRMIPLSEQLEWARVVAEIASEYQNVAIFAVNEFDNCRGRSDWGGNAANCPGKQDIAQLIRVYKDAGIAVVTSDDSFSHPADASQGVDAYVFRLANVGAWPASFHPDRTRGNAPWDPSLNMLNELGRRHGTYLLSETVAWADFSGNCSGLRTCDEQRIQDYVDRCAAAIGCRFTYHCENCLMGTVPTFIPEAR
jgi:hypothetical protein